jgi:speckle-type POZ protein
MLANNAVPPVPRYLGSILLGGVAAALVVLPIAAAMMANRTPTADPCAVTFDASLSARDNAFVVRRMLACSDVTHGRITQSEYRGQVAAIDAAWTARPVVAIAPPAVQWASTVRGFSTQYTTSSWAATKVLGAPDVFPGSGDNANAWASLGADDKAEWIEVGFAQAMPISAVDVYETYNPGAITSIELITADGSYIPAYSAQPGATGQTTNKLHTDVGCTQAPIVAVRVRLASQSVAGWNELDAISITPCAE